MSNNELKRRLKGMLLLEAIKEKDPTKRKISVEQIEKLEKLSGEEEKAFLEFFAKLSVPVIVSLLGLLALVGYRFGMEPDASPDIFYREIGKMILQIFKPKI